MPEEKKEQEKKLIIDEDWKQQAQAEKEKLETEVEKQQNEQAPLPEGSFISLVSLLITQTYMALGAIRPKDEQEVKPDLEFARYHIDTLADLERKTKGNLTPEEEEMLCGALHSLRMMYVRLSMK
ncbi:MAG TPA: DUF1844 domain-containing protein [Sedimentisphaerales bacterium]|nr:DUF1844 domain-containing protein [Sedimentisphaerales bacterium]